MTVKKRLHAKYDVDRLYSKGKDGESIKENMD